MDQIVISGARLAAHIGVTDEERGGVQDLVFDIRMAFDTREAGRTDDFSRTVDYATVVERIEDILRKPFRLIEAVAEEVAERVLSEFPVSEVFVRVAKPGAFPGRRVDHAAVEITRTRDG
ncbi:MAG: dihydroneopterin aldolase [Acidobacteria bacterium]|nr:dihydroneopterin aldolase [Acidobacteriota bacterium]